LSSIIAGICCVIGSFIINDKILLLISLVVASLLVIRHISNIKRIIKGTEPKIKWM
ncbi:glycerol-3-phosphate acyltransferase, partial [Staphylococcus hyicus]